MDYRSPSRANSFALGIAIRAMTLGILAMLFAQLVIRSQLYATAAVVLGIAGVIVVDLVRSIHRTDCRSVELANTHGDSRGWQAEQQRRIDGLQALLDTVAASLIIVDHAGRVTLANRAAQRLAGETVVTLDQIDAIGCASAQRILAMSPGSRQIVPIAGQQSVLVAVAQFTVPQQPPARLISLQRLSGELDAVELKAWQDVTHVLAHEIMNSLTPIASLSESLGGLLRGAAETPASLPADWQEVVAAVDAIGRRSVGLMGFVDRYRRVTQLPPLDAHPLVIEEVLRNIEKVMGSMLAERRIQYTSRVEPGVQVLADRELIEQALINLLLNALDAVATGDEPRIEVECCRREDSQIAIAIMDNGNGIGATSSEQLFVPFFSTKPGGSGIGLSLVRQIALAHGGRVEFQRREPQGSSFALVLPSA